MLMMLDGMGIDRVKESLYLQSTVFTENYKAVRTTHRQ